MNAPGLIPRPLAYGLIVLIALLWGADVAASILRPGHQLNTTLGTAFLVVAGLLGGLSKGKAAADGDAGAGDDAGQPPDVAPAPPAPRAAPARPRRPRLPPTPPPGAEPLPPGAVTFAEIQARLRRENGER